MMRGGSIEIKVHYKNMKKQIYYLTFTFFGALLGFFIHAVVELGFINLMLSDFEKYNFGLTWAEWMMVHTYGTLLLVIGLGLYGYRLGVKFWRILYVDKRYLKRWGIKLKENF